MGKQGIGTESGTDMSNTDCNDTGAIALINENSEGPVYLQTEINRPMTAFEIMLKNSKITAVGRRMFNEDEILGKTKSKIGKTFDPKKDNIESRYMNIFDKKVESVVGKAKNASEDENIIQQKNFEFWDDVVNPENFIGTKRKTKKTNSNNFEERIRVAQKEAENKAALEALEKPEKVETTRFSLKVFSI